MVMRSTWAPTIHFLPKNANCYHKSWKWQSNFNWNTHCAFSLSSTNLFLFSLPFFFVLIFKSYTKFYKDCIQRSWLKISILKSICFAKQIVWWWCMCARALAPFASYNFTVLFFRFILFPFFYRSRSSLCPLLVLMRRGGNEMKSYKRQAKYFKGYFYLLLFDSYRPGRYW